MLIYHYKVKGNTKVLQSTRFDASFARIRTTFPKPDVVEGRWVAYSFPLDVTFTMAPKGRYNDTEVNFRVNHVQDWDMVFYRDS